MRTSNFNYSGPGFYGEPSPEVKQAIKTNQERMKDEIEIGLGSPEDGDFVSLLRCAMEAINAGITINDWSCITEGLVMLGVLHYRIECHLKKN